MMAVVGIAAAGTRDGVARSAAAPVVVPTAPLRASALGPIVAGYMRFAAEVRCDDELALLVFLPDDRSVTASDGCVIAARSGDLLAIPGGTSVTAAEAWPAACLAVLAPRRYLWGALPSRTAVVRLPASASVVLLRRHVARLCALDGAALDAAQGRYVARSVRELLCAAIVPAPAAGTGAPRREAALLERIVDHIDGHLADDLGIAALCETLACSRSALYRAAAPMGGVIEIATQRRLAAVYRMLRDAGECRPIAEIARLNGFADTSQFSRRFRRVYGISAGQLRALPPPGSPGGGALFHPDAASAFAVPAGAG